MWNAVGDSRLSMNAWLSMGLLQWKFVIGVMLGHFWPFWVIKTIRGSLHDCSGPRRHARRYGLVVWQDGHFLRDVEYLAFSPEGARVLTSTLFFHL